MRNPIVTEILDDPDSGGGIPFVVARTTRERSLTNLESENTSYLRGTGNIQPAQPDDLQVLPEEMRTSKTIVIRSTFAFQLGTDGQRRYVSPDLVLYDGCMWDVTRVDDWSAWGFHTAWATLRKERMPDAHAAAMARLL